MNDYKFAFLSENGTESTTVSETVSEAISKSESEELTENVTEGSSEVSMSFKIDGGAMLDTLPIMGKGMLGIFIVTAVIVLTVVVLNKLTGKKKKDKTEE